MLLAYAANQFQMPSTLTLSWQAFEKNEIPFKDSNSQDTRDFFGK